MTEIGLRDWDDIRFFLAVAEAKSFVAAAKQLRTSQSTVSRRVDELEKRLSARLFDRKKQGTELTPQGRTIQVAAKSMERSALEIERGVAGLDREMRGQVTITATEGVGAYWLTPRLLDFVRQHPGICISVDTTNDQRNLDERDADIALRFGRPDELSYRARKVADLSLLPHASKAYLGEFGTPKRIEDFRHHHVVDSDPPIIGPNWDRWIKAVALSKGVVFKSTSPTAVAFAIRDGFGIGLIPRFSSEVLPNVVEIDVDVGPSLELWAVTHEQTGTSQRVRAAMAYIYDLFQTDRYRFFEG